MAGDVIRVDWASIYVEADALVDRLDGREIDNVWGIPRGGIPVAMLVAERLGVPVANELGPGTLVVDDLIDSGRTMNQYRHDYPVDALYRKPHSPELICPGATEIDGWLVFPWEGDEASPEDAVVRLISFIGDDPTREGLIDTPRRVTAALAELTAGLREDPAEILGSFFTESYDEMVVLREVDFTSLCEHHLLPFTGTTSVGYIPNGRVVGISKLARLVECFARRPQLQERMTEQIAAALETHVKPLGVGVVVRAHHSCMACRGVKKASAELVTSALLGYMRVDGQARAEFLRLADGAA